MKNVTYYDLSGTDPELEYNLSLDRYPDKCPHCHKFQEPIFATAVKNNYPLDSMEVVFKCAHHICSKLFIAYYRAPLGGTSVYQFNNVQSANILKEEFGEEINDVSPKFSEIYNQAKHAEEMDLNEIAGMGYRKALEFLIKDYLINFKEEDNDTISRLALGACINNYTTANLKEVASRAVWLGNDETHYEKFYETEYGINDLKTLINLAVNWIKNEILTKKYMDMERQH